MDIFLTTKNNDATIDYFFIKFVLFIYILLNLSALLLSLFNTFGTLHDSINAAKEMPLIGWAVLFCHIIGILLLFVIFLPPIIMSISLLRTPLINLLHAVASFSLGIGCIFIFLLWYTSDFKDVFQFYEYAFSVPITVAEFIFPLLWLITFWIHLYKRSS